MTSRDNANFYTAAKNNPEVLEKRKQRIAELDASIQQMQSKNPGRIPDWDAHRIMQMDLFALQHGKRCIMWDDSGPGFFLMLNWDWITNMPSEPTSTSDRHTPGWWMHAKELLQPPLLDPTVKKEDLAVWLDIHTMKIHHKLLDNLHAINKGPGACIQSESNSDDDVIDMKQTTADASSVLPIFVLDPERSEYGSQLDTLTRQNTEPSSS